MFQEREIVLTVYQQSQNYPSKLRYLSREFECVL